MQIPPKFVEGFDISWQIDNWKTLKSLEIVRLPKTFCEQVILHLNEHHWKQFIWLIDISTTTYELQTSIFYTYLQGGGAGLTTPPTPIDTEFRRLDVS